MKEFAQRFAFRRGVAAASSRESTRMDDEEAYNEIPEDYTQDPARCMVFNIANAEPIRHGSFTENWFPLRARPSVPQQRRSPGYGFRAEAPKIETAPQQNGQSMAETDARVAASTRQDYEQCGREGAPIETGSRARRVSTPTKVVVPKRRAMAEVMERIKSGFSSLRSRWSGGGRGQYKHVSVTLK